jgi:prepilin signal peptidase PulO-like enzyme (type II secretory pathway)
MLNKILVVLIGTFAGVLVNYIADVLPVKRRFVKPLCQFCFEPLFVWNYLIWPRYCPACHRRRSFRVWAVEVFYITNSLWLWLHPPDRLGYVLSLALLVYLGVVMVIDMQHRLIMHPVSWTGAALCLGLGWHLHGWVYTLIGGVVGYVLFLGLYYLGDFFARWVARRRGVSLDEVALGFGDVNLAGILGLLLGWPGITVGLVLAIFLGGIVSLIYILWMLITRRYKNFAAIPYGPFLVISAVFLVFLKDYFT